MRDILKFNRQEVYTFLSSFHPFSPRLNQLRVHSGLSLSQLSFREHVLNYKVTKISTKAIFYVLLSKNQSLFFNPQTYCRTVFGIVHLDFREKLSQWSQ